jgi:hypothetical protein
MQVKNRWNSKLKHEKNSDSKSFEVELCEIMGVKDTPSDMEAFQASLLEGVLFEPIGMDVPVASPASPAPPAPPAPKTPKTPKTSKTSESCGGAHSHSAAYKQGVGGHVSPQMYVPRSLEQVLFADETIEEADCDAQIVHPRTVSMQLHYGVHSHESLLEKNIPIMRCMEQVQ